MQPQINLSKPLIDLKFDPAKELYASAEELMLEGNYKQSLTKFYNIYREHPKSLIAPQALYTTGWILENDLLLSDSAASVYDTLIAKYPTSVYVKKVAKKVTAYKQEKVRLQKVIQDSLNALNNIVKDSTLVSSNVIKPDSLEIVEDVLAMEDENEAGKNNLIDPKLDVMIEKKNTVVTSKKKLDPLWDPRKHFN